jgi:uncharacterized protein YjbI with pentapeptide repeats
MILFGFSIGFILCFLLGMFFWTFHKSKALKAPSDKPISRKRLVFLGSLSVVGILLFTVGLSFFLQQKKMESAVSFQSEIEFRKAQALRLSQQTKRVNLLIEEIQHELRNSDTRRLSEHLKERIVYTSKLLEPLPSSEKDSSGERRLISKERGILLMSLIHLDIDSADFAYIIQKGDYQYAYVHDTEINHVDLKGINLKGAHFKEVIFRYVDLSEASMDSLVVTSAQFIESSLIKSSLINSKIFWSSFHKCFLDKYDLRASFCSNTNFTNCIGKGFNIRMSTLDNCLIKNSDFNQGNLSRSKLYFTRIQNSNFEGGDFRLDFTTHTEFRNLNLQDVKVFDDFLSTICSNNNQMLLGKNVNYKVQLDTQIGTQKRFILVKDD